MAIKKITFDGANVSSLMDADVNFFRNGCTEVGVLALMFNGKKPLTATISNNNIYFSKGYIEIYGRRIVIEDNTSVYVSLDKIAYGYVIVDIDLESNSCELKCLEGTATTYPALTQKNLYIGGKVYQYPIFKYYKTTSSIVEQPIDLNYILSPQPRLSFDSTPTLKSSNPVTSDGIKKELDKKVTSIFTQTINGVEVTNTIENNPDKIVIRRHAWSKEFQKNGTSEVILDSKGMHLHYSFPDPACSGGMDDAYWISQELHMEDGYISLKSRQDQEDSGYGTEVLFGLHGFQIKQMEYGEENYILDSFNPQQHIVLHQVRFVGAGQLGAFTLSILDNSKYSIQNQYLFYQQASKIVGCSSMEGLKGFLYGGVSDDAKSLIYYVYDSAQEVYIKKQALINFDGMQDNMIVLY
jgi:hypothetical protein